MDISTIYTNWILLLYSFRLTLRLGLDHLLRLRGCKNIPFVDPLCPPTLCTEGQGGGAGVHPLWQGEMWYRHPLGFLDSGHPSLNSWSVAAPLKDSKLFFRAAKIVQILMKIVKIQVLFSIFGNISLFFDLYCTI